MSAVQEVVSFLQELKEEPGMSRRFREKADEVALLLAEDSLMAIEKAVSVLEDLASLDMPSYQRTQVWEVVSMLESLHTLKP